MTRRLGRYLLGATALAALALVGIMALVRTDGIPSS